jgi:endoglucanase
MRDEAGRSAVDRVMLDITAIPTAAGREWRVAAFIETWVEDREDLALRTDRAGNMVIERVEADETRPPLLITAHLDHPAFVVDGMVGDSAVRLGFRGGVHDPYFREAPIEIITRDDRVVPARVVEAGPARPFRVCVAELEGDEDGAALGIAPGDIGRWRVAAPEIAGGMVHTHACDDLAAVAAALVAFDRLRSEAGAGHVRLLFTRAEEVGFVGAIWALKHGTVAPGSRMILLENSRAFADSPIGAGPVVRVGDRLSTFSPTLTAAISRAAEEIEKERAGSAAPFLWQRKLMPGGACEATAYQAWGYEAACVCLPLGNYHNMADLDRVQAGDAEAVRGARCDREFVSMDDVHGMIDLLVALGSRLADAPPLMDRLEAMYAERSSVLNDVEGFGAEPG